MTTANLQVASSTDDAFEDADGTMTRGSGTIGSIVTGNQWGGFRFIAPVPQATVSNALFWQYVTTTDNDTLLADIYGEAHDNAPTFANTSNNISGRTLTTNKTSVNAVNVGTGWYSIDVTAVVQEILSRPGWVSGNGLAIIIDGLPGSSWRCRAYDGIPSQAAKLDIVYTTGGGGGGGQPMIARARLVPGLRRPHTRQGW